MKNREKKIQTAAYNGACTVDIRQQNERTYFEKNAQKWTFFEKKVYLLQYLFAETVGILMSIHEPKKRYPMHKLKNFQGMSVCWHEKNIKDFFFLLERYIEPNSHFTNFKTQN